ncbi:response regulator [bacterium]|nr:response regulator [bacterium]
MNNPPIVVVVDDEPAILDLIQAQLAAENYDIRPYASGTLLLDDLEILATADLFLLDVMMPAISGFELCQVIRERRSSFAPIILVTALGDVEHKVRGLNAGADDFLTKPTNTAEMKARIRANLRAREYYCQLELAKQDVERLSLFKDKLMDMIVHDIRNPLGSVALSIQLMGDPPNPAKVDPTTWQLTGRQVDFALEMCEQLLDIKRQQSNELEVLPYVVHLRETVNQAVQPLLLFARERKVEIKSDIEDLTFESDERLLTRILMNLLNNAVKFSPGEDAVEIKGRRAGDQVVITVVDHGPGIPHEFQDKIFELFSTAEVSRQVRGYGIGLAFCSMAVQSLGGFITVESEPGQGSRFIVTLPWVEAREEEF